MVPAPVTPLIVVCGLTAAGKTAASIELAQRLSAEIIAADSRTIYRRMDIGTAKPSPEQRRAVPHHLIDIADPDEVVTLAAYRRQATAVIAAIRGRGRPPLMVGGTGLYIRAVVDGFRIPEVPPDPDLRRRLDGLEAETPGILHARLAEVDPLAAARIHPRNVRRLVRALEVYEHTHTPITALQRRADPVGRAVQIGLTMNRAQLYHQIDRRVEEQIAAGLVNEVRRLLEAGYERTLPSMQGLGYKEIVEYLDGAVTLDDAVRRLKQHTRRFARRQYTWFRRDPRVHWLSVDGLSPEEVALRISTMIQSEGIGG